MYRGEDTSRRKSITFLREKEALEYQTQGKGEAERLPSAEEGRQRESKARRLKALEENGAGRSSRPLTSMKQEDKASAEKKEKDLR